jgi:hypothetical protein
MTALVVLGVTLLWSLLGVWVWRRFLNRRFSSMLVRVLAFILFTAFWLVTPVLDEILGAREFEQLCRELPEVKFYGPAPVGGAFFEQDGTPKWRTEEQFSRIRSINGWEHWEEIIDNEDKRIRISRFPVPIIELDTVYFNVKTKRKVFESFAIYSPGGWIKRGLGWGSHAPYQCRSKGRWPREATWIVFDSNQINSKGDAQ